MKIVSFLGEKGGVGKTTNAHSTAHGLSMLGIPAAYVMTDKRELPSDEHRVYTVIDGRTVPQLEQAVATARQHEGKDAIILPFTADDDSVYVVAREMAQFAGAWALPSNWPTNSKAAEVDTGYIQKLEALYPTRLLAPTPATHSIKDIMLQSFNGSLLPPAQRYCRALARQISNVVM
jgi:hypothetical protein